MNLSRPPPTPLYDRGHGLVELQGIGAEAFLSTQTIKIRTLPKTPLFFFSLSEKPFFFLPSSLSQQMLIEGAGASSMPKAGSVPVYLNVYDITAMNGCAYFLGLGAYHSGVQGQISFNPGRPILILAFFISYLLLLLSLFLMFIYISYFSILPLLVYIKSSRNLCFC